MHITKNYSGDFQKTYWDMGTQIFQKSRSYLKIPAAKRATWSMLHKEEPQTLCATTQNAVAQVTWHPGVVHPCSGILLKFVNTFQILLKVNKMDNTH
jgi:hypothetical protein